VLILLPPSEGKTQRRRGAALDLADLSFPELTPIRESVMEATAAVSARPDAYEVLRVSPNLEEDVARNTRLLTAATAPAGQVYSGVLYDAFDFTSLDAASRRRALRRVVIVSALFGAVRIGDRIPAYRLHLCVHLPGIGELAATWRPELRPVLEREAGHRLVVDCRSTTYAAAWTPKGSLAERRVLITVPGASHMAKHTRGLVARRLVQSPDRPTRPADLAELLADTFDVSLTEPVRPGRPWQLAVTA